MQISLSDKEVKTCLSLVGHDKALKYLIPEKEMALFSDKHLGELPGACLGPIMITASSVI